MAGDQAPGAKVSCQSLATGQTVILPVYGHGHPACCQGQECQGDRGQEPQPGGLQLPEISKLLAQFPLKSTEMLKAPDSKMVLEETRVIKDFLQSSMFSGPGPRGPGLGPFLLLPPLHSFCDSQQTPQAPAQKKQLPVFAKICSRSPRLTPSWRGTSSG